jgi:ABC-type Fe3+ transport system permease subunit
MAEAHKSAPNALLLINLSIGVPACLFLVFAGVFESTSRAAARTGAQDELSAFAASMIVYVGSALIGIVVALILAATLSGVGYADRRNWRRTLGDMLVLAFAPLVGAASFIAVNAGLKLAGIQ